MTTLKNILIPLAILALYGIAGHMDYEDAVRLDESMRTGQTGTPAFAPATPAEYQGPVPAATETPLAPSHPCAAESPHPSWRNSCR